MSTIDFFVNRSKLSIIDNILLEMEPHIAGWIERANEREMDEKGHELSDFAKEMIRLQIIYSMTSAIEKYIVETDILVEYKIRVSDIANYVISLVIERDGIKHTLNTDAVSAGGHNIQKYHYRYLVKCKLPRIETTKFSDVYKQKIKNLSKVEKYDLQIKEFLERIEKLKFDIVAGEAMSDKEIIEKTDEDRYRFLQMTWNDVIERGIQDRIPTEQALFDRNEEIITL